VLAIVLTGGSRPRLRGILHHLTNPEMQMLPNINELCLQDDV
jgi:hypothetical protein